MEKIFIVGNPNTGKSTLFNNITKSDEHTGNWHGVTVEAKSKKINFFGREMEVVDLPGLYSLNTYSYEEQVAKDLLLKNQNAKILYIVDANEIERNLYLFMQLKSYNFQIKILINNYGYFNKMGGVIEIDKLSKMLDVPCQIYDAKRDKCKKDFFTFSNYSLVEEMSPESIYTHIANITTCCVSKREGYVYGKAKSDKWLLNPICFLLLFFVGMFLALYLIFFAIGPKLSSGITFVLNSIVRFPLNALLMKITSNKFVLALFDEGVMSACLAVCSFLPQVCLLYVFLSVLENSGLISRFAFMLDDFLNKLGLNGKCVYTMLMGFGCNTSATVTAKNMPDKNSRIKTVMITPFMSCSAKLPIYSVILSAVLGANNIWVIAGLYLLGIAGALTLSIIFEKTCLKSQTSNFLIEFPPLKFPELKDVAKTSAKSSRNFLSKVFGIIVTMSVVVWLLSNVTIGFKYTGNYETSILYLISGKFNVLFKPLGFGTQAVVCTLVVGLVAKELIVSTMMIFNHSSSLTELIYSLTLPASLINFNFASGLSFLVFVLLYAPCISNLAIMVKEIGWRWTSVSLASQFAFAYISSFVVYNLCLGNWVVALLGLLGGVGMVMLFVKSKKFKSCVGCVGCKGGCVK